MVTLSQILDATQEAARKRVLAEKVRTAKENRFTTTSRILADKGISVQVINDCAQACADYNVNTKVLRLNEAFPQTDNPVEALTFDRGKLFHELGHALFTTDDGTRARLYQKAENKKAFLDVSNVLEDGRIERLLSDEWKGAKHYLDSLLKHEFESGQLTNSEINGLVLYVRTKLFRNGNEKAFYASVLPLINKAVWQARDTAQVCEIAFEICEKLYPKQAPEPQGEGEEQGEGKDKGGEEKSTPEGKPEPRQGQDEGDDQQEQGEEQGESLSLQGEDDKGEGESKNGKPQGKAESESKPQGEQEQSNGKPDETVSDEVKKQIDEIVEKAKEQIKQEVEADYDSILLEAQELMTSVVQQYADSDEDTLSDELALLFTSLLVEVNRTKYTQSREGVLNTLALQNALTSRKCFQTKEECAGTPYVALLLDTSASQGSRQIPFTKASRIIHGALQKAKVETLVIEYGHRATIINEVPVAPFQCAGRTTDTGTAMKVANDWLEEKQAERALMIVCTDGAPDSLVDCDEQKARCESLNGYVLGVRIGFKETDYGRNDTMMRLNQQFHTHVNVPDVSKLPQAIAPELENFIAGV